MLSKERYDYLKETFNLNDAQLKEKEIYPIHPDFRLIAIGEPPNLHSNTGNWITPEVLSLFVFHQVRTLSKEEELQIITSKVRLYNLVI